MYTSWVRWDDCVIWDLGWSKLSLLMNLIFKLLWSRYSVLVKDSPLSLLEPFYKRKRHVRAKVAITHSNDYLLSMIRLGFKKKIRLRIRILKKIRWGPGLSRLSRIFWSSWQDRSFFVGIYFIIIVSYSSCSINCLSPPLLTISLFWHPKI